MAFADTETANRRAGDEAVGSGLRCEARSGGSSTEAPAEASKIPRRAIRIRKRPAPEPEPEANGRRAAAEDPFASRSRLAAGRPSN